MQYVDIVVAVCFTAVALPSVRLLQLLGYLPQRGYYKIICSLYYMSIVVMCAVLYFVEWTGWEWTPVLACALALTLACVYALHIKKPPLKYTPRAMRLIVFTGAVCYGLTWCLPLFAVCLLIPFAVFGAWLVTLPYELSMYCYYFNKARKKIIAKQSQGVKVIGVTGSYGKTSVKLILSQLLLDSVCTPESCNTPMGISKFVNCGGLNVNGAKYFIVEMGARRKGDISRLCKLARPQYAILTGIAPQHIKTFGSVENIIKEKSKLIKYLHEDGYAVLNGQDNYVRNLTDIGVCQKLLTETEQFGHKVTSISVDGTAIELTDCDKRYSFTVPLLGVANADNVTVALAMCKVLGQDIEHCTELCTQLKQIPHRMSVIRNGNLTVIDDGYNANIEGVRRCCATLDYLPEFKIAVAQGIVEGGKECGKLNIATGKLLGTSCNVVIAVGENADQIIEGATQSKCKTVLRSSTLDCAVKLAAKYYKADTIVLFQNDIPQ